MFMETTATFALALAPKFVGNAMLGVEDYLNQTLLKFSETFQGVPVSYENVRFLSDKALIINDSPFMHFKAQCDLMVFAPKVGDTLIGVINRQSPNHIGLLVNNLFNASIASSKMATSQFKFVADENAMQEDEEEPSNVRTGKKHSIPQGNWVHTASETTLDVGTSLEFEVSEVVKSHGFLALKGNLNNVEQFNQ